MERHDPFLKTLYKAGARDAVALFFPELAARIDWEHIQWVDKEVPILGEQKRSVVADLVGLTCDTEGHSLELLIHPEIQMEGDEGMGWRVMQYGAGLTLQQANPDARVVTIVFYHCRGTGGIAERIHRLEFAGRAVLEVGYWSVGLGDLSAEQYAASENPMAWALASWMRKDRSARPKLRLDLLGKILRVADEYYRYLLADTIGTYFRLSAREREQERRLLESGAYGEVREVRQTWLGKIEADAERRGRQEGQQEGQQEALQYALLAILRSRFPALPQWVEARIRDEHDVRTLNLLVQRALAAVTPDDLWRAAEGH